MALESSAPQITVARVTGSSLSSAEGEFRRVTAAGGTVYPGQTVLGVVIGRAVIPINALGFHADQ